MPPDFVQHKEPKILVDGLQPAEWPDDPSLEWCPPGHGDLYTALLTSGMLDALLERGYRYAFMSNSDNLGAVLEPRILAWIAREEIPFAMEVTDRTEADRKGGHIARRKDGGELSCARPRRRRTRTSTRFRTSSRHRYVNTNNLWLDLRALRDGAGRARGRARAAADRQPQDGRSGRQVDARGVPARDRDGRGDRRVRRRAARCACRAGASRRSRRPRTCWRCARTPTCSPTTRASSSPPAATARRRSSTSTTTTTSCCATSTRASRDGAPSLVECERLAVEGDVTFGARRRRPRPVAVEGPRRIEDGAVLEG